MHEVDMTRCLILSLEEWRRGRGDPCPRVHRVHLQVGAFTCVEPEALRFTYNAAIAGGWLSQSRLEIQPIPLVGRCLACGGRYEPSPEMAYRSPCCDHPLEEILSGRELKISHIDYDLPDPAICHP